MMAGFNLAMARETEARELDAAIVLAGVQNALENPERGFYLVAAAENEAPIAALLVTFEWSDWRNGWIWWFQSVYVAADSRGLGIFRALHARIRVEAHAEPDVIGLRLYVEHDNEPAQRTYQALGMVPGGYLVYEEIWPTSEVPD